MSVLPSNLAKSLKWKIHRSTMRAQEEKLAQQPGIEDKTKTHSGLDCSRWDTTSQTYTPSVARDSPTQEHGPEWANEDPESPRIISGGPCLLCGGREANRSPGEGCTGASKMVKITFFIPVAGEDSGRHCPVCVSISVRSQVRQMDSPWSLTADEGFCASSGQSLFSGRATTHKLRAREFR